MKKFAVAVVSCVSVLIFIFFIWTDNYGRESIAMRASEQKVGLFIVYDKAAISKEYDKFKEVFVKELEKMIESTGENIPAGRYLIFIDEKRNPDNNFEREIRISLQYKKNKKIDLSGENINDLGTLGNMQVFAKDSVNKIFQAIQNLKKEKPAQPIFYPRQIAVQV